MNRQAGFTLIELMITVGILGIVLGFAVPALGDFFTKKQVIDATEGVYGTLQEARGESIARSRDLFVEFDGGDIGISVNDDCDPSITDPTITDACVLVVDDGDLLIDPGDGSVDTGDLVLNVTRSTDYSNITIATTSGGISFKYVRGTASNKTVTIRHAKTAPNGDTVGLNVVVSLLGRIRICRPSGLATIAGYPDCP